MTTTTLRRIRDLPRWTDGPPVVGPMLGFVRDPHHYFLRPHAELGPIHRMSFLGREHVVLSGLEANEFCFGNDELFDYAAVLKHFLLIFGERSLTQLSGDEHQRKRRIIASGLKATTLARQGAPMVAILRDRLDRRVGETHEITELAKDLVTSVQGRAVFHFDMPPHIPTSVAWLETRLLSATFAGPLRHLLLGTPGWRRRNGLVDEFLGEVIERHRLGEVPDGADMLSSMLKREDADDPFTREELIADLKESLFAGAETATSVLYWAFILCWLHPEWLASLREEVDAIDLDDFGVPHDHERLLATTLEVERMRPPGTIFPRVVASDFEFHGTHIPAGTHILHAMGVTHFLEEIYESPLTFRPERFIERRDYPRAAHTVFGGGAHLCLGLSLARFEISLALATVAREYELEFLVAPTGDSRSSAAITAPRERSLPVRVHRRTPG